jgi:hypothetical protein
LVWINRKKISQIINDYLCLPFFLLIILWGEGEGEGGRGVWRRWGREGRDGRLILTLSRAWPSKKPCQEYVQLGENILSLSCRYVP